VIHPDSERRPTGRGFEMDINWVLVVKTLVESIVYSLIGIVMFATSFLIIKLITPFSLRKEIEEDQNTALAIMIGSVILGLAIVIAAAIGG
jgi:putative membrane protein